MKEMAELMAPQQSENLLQELDILKTEKSDDFFQAMVHTYQEAESPYLKTTDIISVCTWLYKRNTAWSTPWAYKNLK